MLCSLRSLDARIQPDLKPPGDVIVHSTCSSAYFACHNLSIFPLFLFILSNKSTGSKTDASMIGIVKSRDPVDQPIRVSPVRAANSHILKLLIPS